MSWTNPFAGLQVLIVGDVMVDAYWYGSVHRISPEAPVPVVDITGKESRLGGAANVALNIRSMEAAPFLCTVIGEDEAGDTFLRLCEESGMPTAGIIRRKNRPTTVKTRIMGNQQQLMRLDEEQTQPIDEVTSMELEERFASLLPNADVVIFEDYDKGVLHPTNIQRLVNLCKERGVPTTVDPKKVNFNAFHGVSLFKPNWKELREGLHLSQTEVTLEVLKMAADRLRQEQGIERLFITLSEKGVFLDDGKESHLIPAHIRKIADVSGAGDTVISIASLALSLGWPSEKIAQLSNLAGGLVCEEVGVVPIQKEIFFAEAQEFNIL
jgi:rfaE bifunctional protein kinase chain/domain